MSKVQRMLREIERHMNAVSELMMYEAWKLALGREVSTSVAMPVPKIAKIFQYAIDVDGEKNCRGRQLTNNSQPDQSRNYRDHYRSSPDDEQAVYLWSVDD